VIFKKNFLKTMNQLRLHLLEGSAALGAALLGLFVWSGRSTTVEKTAATAESTLPPTSRARVSLVKAEVITAKTRDDFSTPSQSQITRTIANSTTSAATVAESSTAARPSTYRQAFGHAPVRDEQSLSARPDLLTREELEYRALQVTSEADQELAQLMSVLKLDDMEQDVAYEALARTSTYYVPGMQFSQREPTNAPENTNSPKPESGAATPPTSSAPVKPPVTAETPNAPIIPRPEPPKPPELVSNDPPRDVITPPDDDTPIIDTRDNANDEEERDEFWRIIADSLDEKLRNGSN
jgi:hypothetical protein